MSKVNWEIFGEKHELDVELSEYTCTGNPAIQLLKDGEPFAVASVNVPDVYGMKYLVAIKDYSENTGILKALIDAGAVSEPLWYTHSGFVDIPVCRLLTRGDF